MKKITLLILSVITLLLLTTNVVFATENSGNSVYASKSIQEKVYQMINDESFDYYVILKSDNVEILKESITPVYTMDLLKYAQTGELDIIPAVNGISPSEQEKKLGNVYIAKTVTDSGEFAGNVEFYIEDGVAYGLLFSPSVALEQYFTKETSSYMASCSYADHAKRIQNILRVLDVVVNIHSITEIAIEDGFTGPNKKGSLSLAKLRGAIVGYFGLKGCSIDESEPKSTRVNMGLKGNASKEEVAEYILNLYPELIEIIGPYSDKNNKDKTSDMYDSVCIGLAYLNKQE